MVILFASNTPNYMMYSTVMAR